MIYVGDLNKLLLYTGIIIAYEKPIMYPPVPTRNPTNSAFWFSENNGKGDLHPRFAPAGQLEALLVSSCVGKLSSFHCSKIVLEEHRGIRKFFSSEKVISQEPIVEWHDVFLSKDMRQIYIMWEALAAMAAMQDPGRRNMWKTWLTENSTWQGSLIYTYWEDQLIDAKVAGFIFEGFKTGQVFKGW